MKGKSITLAIIISFLTIIFNSQKSWSVENATSLVDGVKAEFKGDLPEIRKRGILRVLVPLSRTSFFIDKGVERGLSVELIREFETLLNTNVESEKDRLTVVLIPTARDKILSDLTDGHGDIAAANLTITSIRSQQVDFSEPFSKNVREVIVTIQDIKPLTSLKDLAGKTIHVRKSSSYFESIVAANQQLQAKGLNPINVAIAEEWLEDEDLLEMVQAGAIEAIVMDDHKASLWQGVYKNLKIHNEFALRKGGRIGWAFRKNSPKLAESVNAFVKTSKKGTLLGNILIKRYYGSSDWITNPNKAEYTAKLRQLYALFKKYGRKYNVDPILLAALSFQESKFDQTVKSQAGAVGIMQILPSTADDPNVGIKNIDKMEPNIEAGTKYLRFMANQYFSDGNVEEIEKILMALASYNAGPNAVARLRGKSKDPNRWFQSVEWEVARSIGSEPVKYVKNIYIYHVLFKSLALSDAFDLK
jgi:membrane-bound lytic murein transglycosylase MltF